MKGKTVLTTLSLVAVLIVGACAAPSDGDTMTDTSTDTMAEASGTEEPMAEDEMAEGDMADDEAMDEEMSDEEMSDDATGDEEMMEDEMTEGVTFHIRLENLSGDASVSTPFSPGVWVLHNEPGVLFTAGQPNPGQGLEAQSEEGNPSNLDASLEAAGYTHGVFNTPEGATDPGPATPGNAFAFEITATPEIPYLFFASMFGQSNDLFIGPDEQGIALFDDEGNPISGDVTEQIYLWDAGTEMNEEPGVGPNQAPRQPEANTGPADEDNTVRMVDDGFSYPAVPELVRITIEAGEMME